MYILIHIFYFMYGNYFLYNKKYIYIKIHNIRNNKCKLLEILDANCKSFEIGFIDCVNYDLVNNHRERFQYVYEFICTNFSLL